MTEFYRTGADRPTRMCEYGRRLLRLITELDGTGRCTVLDTDGTAELWLQYDTIALLHQPDHGIAAVTLETPSRRYGKLGTTITPNTASPIGVDGELWFEDLDGSQYRRTLSAFRSRREVAVRHSAFHALANTMMDIMQAEQERADFAVRFTEP